MGNTITSKSMDAQIYLREENMYPSVPRMLQIGFFHRNIIDLMSVANRDCCLQLRRIFVPETPF